MESKKPAESVWDFEDWEFSALLLAINRDMVIGKPPTPTVRNTPNTDMDAWYTPNPSSPSWRESTIRYKKPRPRSRIEKRVNREAVA